MSESLGSKVGAMLIEQEEYRTRRIKDEISILDEREQRYGDRTIQVDIRHYRQILLERLGLIQHIVRMELMLSSGVSTFTQPWPQPIIIRKEEPGNKSGDTK